MNSVFILIWLFALWVAYKAVFVFVGAAGIVSMFPEGNRYWLWPAQLTSLAFFALVVLWHPGSDWFRSLL